WAISLSITSLRICVSAWLPRVIPTLPVMAAMTKMMSPVVRLSALRVTMTETISNTNPDPSSANAAMPIGLSTMSKKPGMSLMFICVSSFFRDSVLQQILRTNTVQGSLGDGDVDHWVSAATVIDRDDECNGLSFGDAGEF